MSRLDFARLRRWLAAHHAAARGGPSALERLEAANAQRASRRAFLGQVGALAAATALPFELGAGCASTGAAAPKDRSVAASGLRIAIVGGGMAGLACCDRLARAGVHAEVYEASGRPGGRMLSPRGLWPGFEQHAVELGGSFVNSTHTALLRHVRELGLELIDARDDRADLERPYVIGGRRYREAEIIARFEPVARAVRAARDTLVDGGDDVGYTTPAGAETLDRQSVAEFLEGAGGDMVVSVALEAIYTTEYGMPVGEQSALNLVLELGVDDPETIRPIVESDEVFTLPGGVERIPEALARRLKDRVHYGKRLEAVREDGLGGYVLTFEDAFGGGAADVPADVVVMALPFTILRDLELRVELPAVKWRAIKELGYGSNAKLLVPFRTPFWRDAGFSGDGVLEVDNQTTWDATRQRNTPLAVITDYTGGERGISLGQGTVAEQVERFMAPFEALYPGARGQLAGAGVRKHWPSVPTVKASYSAYRVGQWTGIAGAEIEPVGAMYFCGEHTSREHQGYMNGAAETGEQAADAVLARLDGNAVGWGAAPRACRRRPIARTA
ncbi:MAG: FAD-dependent oxidoreductase [Deltaproteobacteria bacterium]|nr:FAD-dependent oxidoreductase [Deltaproteobacteria bacterium]